MPAGIRVDLSGVVERNFDPIPTGTYPLYVFDGKLETSGESAKHPGSLYVAWEHNVASGDFENRHLWDNTIISHGECDCDDAEKFNGGLFKIKQLLTATGKWTPDEMNDDEFDWEIEDVVGSLVAAKVAKVKDDYQGGDEYKNTIKKYSLLDQNAVQLGSSVSSSLLPG